MSWTIQHVGSSAPVGKDTAASPCLLQQPKRSLPQQPGARGRRHLPGHPAAGEGAVSRTGRVAPAACSPIRGRLALPLHPKSTLPQQPGVGWPRCQTLEKITWRGRRCRESRLTECKSAAGDHAGARTNLRSAASSRDAAPARSAGHSRPVGCICWLGRTATRKPVVPSRAPRRGGHEGLLDGRGMPRSWNLRGRRETPLAA